MDERLSWEEIQKKYYKKVIGLTNIEKDNNNNILYATVKYTTKTKSYEELIILAMKGEISLEFIGIDEWGK